jgi:hypothetical protein
LFLLCSATWTTICLTWKTVHSTPNAMIPAT